MHRRSATAAAGIMGLTIAVGLVAACAVPGSRGVSDANPAPSTPHVSPPILRRSSSFRLSYSRAIQLVGLQGHVIMNLAVTPKGRVDPDSSTITDASNRMFSDSLRQSLKGLRFNPARSERAAVPGRTTVAFDFVLDRCDHL